MQKSELSAKSLVTLSLRLVGIDQSNTATFSLQTFVTSANTNVTISAIHSATTKTKVVTVQAPSSTPYATAVLLGNANQVALTGGSTATLTVYLNTNASKNTTVNLPSNNTSAATVAASPSQKEHRARPSPSRRQA